MADDEQTTTEGQEDNEQEETSDWTDVIELHNKSKLKPYSIEELATSSITHTIPYLEVYRTDELWYEEYESPFLGGSGDSTGTSSDESGDGTGSSSGDSGSGGSNGGNNGNNTPTYSSKSKNGRLKSELKSLVNNYYKKGANHNTLITRYMDCKNNMVIIAGVTAWSNKWLKSGVNVKQLNTSVYKLKLKYK